MKKIIQIFYLFLAMFTLMLTGCQKESIDPVTELAIDGEQKVITVEKNGVGIEFYLLNEQGQPATVFNEGENFKFHLAIKNDIEPDTAMYIVSDFLRNQELFEVFDKNGIIIGKPWEGGLCLKVSDSENQIKQGHKWIMESLWNETRIFSWPDSTSIRYLQCYFSGLDRKPLRAGKYYTVFTQQFCLGRYLPHPQSEVVCTDTLTLKINFEIK